MGRSDNRIKLDVTEYMYFISHVFYLYTQGYIMHTQNIIV